MSNLKELRKKHEDLGRTIAKMEAKERAKRPEIALGQLWKCRENIYIVYRSWNLDSSYILVIVLGEHIGSRWCNEGFGGDDDDFEYLGMARDLLTIKGEE